MSYKTVFKRYELKYILNRAQKNMIMDIMTPFMFPDEYGKTTIRNLYFDTDSYRLIRRSIEKPIFKEKLRLRSYSQATKDSTVFAELKRKYDSVVYKRRLALNESEAMDWLEGYAPCPKRSQISEEIDYFLSFYGSLHPTVFLSYEREAFYSKEDPSFRITFDENILCRCNELSLRTEAYGERILDENKILMEIKCSGGIPLWLVKILSKEKIYKTAFSKYGTAYTKFIFPETLIIKEENCYVGNII